MEGCDDTMGMQTHFFAKWDVLSPVFQQHLQKIWILNDFE